MRRCPPCPVFCAIFLAITATCAAQSTMVPWLTRSADNARTGWNPHETQLTQALVLSKGIIRATIIPVMGDARGMEAQPLILLKVQTARGMRDVLVLPSMADVVRGVDAHDGSGIWQTALGMPVTSSTQIDSKNINQHWGCISTGVIDPDTQRLYQVCWVSKDGTWEPSNRPILHVRAQREGWKPGRSRRWPLLRLRRQNEPADCHPGLDGRRGSRHLDGGTRRSSGRQRFAVRPHRKRRFRWYGAVWRIVRENEIHASCGREPCLVEGRRSLDAVERPRANRSEACSGDENGRHQRSFRNRADANSALLACTIPYGDANANVVNGRLLIYDPVHLAPDKSLKVLWDSQRWGVQFLYNKFNPPVIDGGQIYVPNYNDGVDVYRLVK